MSESVFYTHMESPLGTLLLVAGARGLLQVGFPSGKREPRVGPGWREERAHFREALRELEQYFRGERRDFDLELDPLGSAFQLAVWSALREIPYATTISYGELARRVGRSSAARAVGAANGRNPLPIVIPCHRVIGADGSLTGFGGGLGVKQALLELERRHAGEGPSPGLGPQARLPFEVARSGDPAASGPRDS